MELSRSQPSKDRHEHEALRVGVLGSSARSSSQPSSSLFTLSESLLLTLARNQKGTLIRIGEHVPEQAHERVRESLSESG